MSATEPADDGALLDRARAGEREAFDELVARHRERLRRFAASLCEAEADDVAAEAVARAWADLGKFEGRSRFSTWLLGIGLNLCRHAIRRRARHAEPTAPEAIDANPARRGVLSSILRREVAERVDLAIERLPLNMREVIVLRFVEELDYDEIAQITGVTAATARVRAHRARALLRTDLGSVVDTLWREPR